MIIINVKSVLLVTLMLSLFGISAAQADPHHKQTEPIELLIDFRVTGEFLTFNSEGKIVYTLDGPGYAPAKIFKSGEISDTIKPHRQVTELQGGRITFDGFPTDPVVRFSCIAGSCNMPFADGSVLSSDAGVPLEGRAINFWGPVVNSPDFDAENLVFPIRILGCGGLKEIAGKGKYAGMVGSICFNGVLNNNYNNPTKLTGSSKCTITLHTPQDPDVIP